MGHRWGSWALAAFVAVACGGSDETTGDGPAGSSSSSGAGGTASTTSAGGATTTTSGSGGAGGNEGREYSTDPNDFFGTPRCDTLDALFCDDFEDDPLGGPPTDPGWSVDAGAGAAVEISDEQAGRGSRSLKVTGDLDYSRGWVRQEGLFPREQFYGRVLYRVENPGPDDFVHWDLVEAIGRDAQGEPLKRMRFGGVSLRNEQGTDFIFNRYFFNFEMTPRPQGFDEFTQPEIDGSAPLAWGEWHCVEFFYDAPSDEAIMWYDGVERVRFTGTVTEGQHQGRTADFPTFDGVNLGWTTYQNIDRPFTVFIDEVALDDARIGCGN